MSRRFVVEKLKIVTAVYGCLEAAACSQVPHPDEIPMPQSDEVYDGRWAVLRVTGSAPQIVGTFVTRSQAEWYAGFCEQHTADPPAALWETV